MKKIIEGTKNSFSAFFFLASKHKGKTQKSTDELFPFHIIFSMFNRGKVSIKRKQRKKKLMPKRKYMQYQDHKTIDLIDYCVLDKQLSKEKLIVQVFPGSIN